jgi:Flp pilus assembly pilin Flp
MPEGRAGKDIPKNVMLRTTIARMRQFLVSDERGATAIEYAMVAAGIGGAVAATVFSFGSQLKTNFYDKIAALL